MTNSKKNLITIEIDKRVNKDLKDIPEKDVERIFKAIDTLLLAPESGKMLKGSLSPLRRIVVGDYRIVYVFKSQKLIIIIIKIGRRKNVYEKLERLISNFEL
jgi:mRNA interferase RelE/StbE